MKKNINIISLIVSFILGISVVFIIGIFQTNMVRASYSSMGNPMDGSVKEWALGTVIDEWGYIYVLKDELIPPHFYFEFQERVYVQYEVDGFYFVEKYYQESFTQPIYGWIPTEHILLDDDVLY